MSSSTIAAAQFLGEIGVDTHIAYTDGGYADLSNVQLDIAYLGVTELRDGISNGEKGSAPLASYIQLAEAGKKFTFVAGGGTSTSASVQSTLGVIEQLAAAVPGSIKAIEGPNEINNQTLTFNGVGGLQGAINLQQYIYQTVKSSPALSGVAVDYFTGYDTVGFAAGPNPSTTAGLADFDTQHPYPQGGQAPASWVDPSRTLGNEPGATGPFVYTETGYTTNLSDENGVDATVQGKYTLDLLMDAAKDGSSGTYLYQLMDAYKPGSPQGDDGYGLFDENNAPKLAAIGIHNLTTVLADTGTTASTVTPTTLSYSLSGLPSTGDSLEISKSDGTTDIAVWAEPQLWNESTESKVVTPTENVTVDLGAAHAVSVYDLLVGTAPIATYSSTSSVQLQVTDRPLIVQVGAAVTGSTTASDLVYGDQGDNAIHGNQGSDVIYGLQGSDVLYGGQGDDTLFGNQGNDTLYGNQGNDTLYGGQGNDTLYGGQGNDILVGGKGNDNLVGGLGNDTFMFNPGDTSFQSGMSTGDTIADFVTGTDEINFAAGPAATVSNFGMAATASTDFASIQAVAQSIIRGGKAYAFVADGTDGFLFTTGGTGTTIEDAVKLTGAGAIAAVSAHDIAGMAT